MRAYHDGGLVDGQEYDDDVGGPLYVAGDEGVELPPLDPEQECLARQRAAALRLLALFRGRIGKAGFVALERGEHLGRAPQDPDGFPPPFDGHHFPRRELADVGLDRGAAGIIRATRAERGTT